MKKKLIFLWASIMLMASISTGASDESRIQNLLNEKAALLEMIRKAKNDLESAETKRWRKRYAQETARKALEEKAGRLESQYASLANLKNQLEEELLVLRRDEEDKKNILEEESSVLSAFSQLLISEIEKSSENLSKSFPEGLNTSTLILSKALETGKKSTARTDKALQQYVDWLLGRLKLGLTTDLSTRASLFTAKQGARESKVWRLRLGMLSMLELSKDDPDQVQMLFKTGNLNITPWEWRTDLPGPVKNNIRKTLETAITGESIIKIPFDVLQNRSLGKIFSLEKDEGFFAGMLSIIKSGGPIP